MKRSLYFISVAIIISLQSICSSCSNNESNSVTYEITPDCPPDSHRAKAATQSNDISEADSRVKGSEPYNLGRKHAQSLHENFTTTNEIRDELLDINARATNIRYRVGQDAANEYLAGVRDYLRETNDTLAATLF